MEGMIRSLNWSVRLNKCGILGKDIGTCTTWLLTTTRSIWILTSKSLHLKIMVAVMWVMTMEIMMKLVRMKKKNE